VRGSELIRKIEKIAKKRDLSVQFKPRRGKGSHGTLIVGERFAIIPDAKNELKSGTMAAILKQLGIHRSEID
jgi:mRNA interferase HicA